MTNQEWLSSLSKDEFAEILIDKVKGAFWCKDCLFHHSNEHHCIECIAEWLELEHMEVENESSND